MRSFVLVLATTICLNSNQASAQEGRPTGPWKATRSKHGDTLVVRTVSGSTWGDKVHLVEELLIGSKNGDGPDAFGSIQEFALFPDGVFAIFDASVPAVRLFSAEGKHLRTLGRDGAGPGEYRNQALGLRIDRDGNLLMYDPRNARLNRWKEDGTLLPSWIVPTGLYTSGSLQVDDRGNAYIKVLLEQPKPNEAWKIGLARLDANGKIVDTLQAPSIAGDVPPNGTFFEPQKDWHLNRAGEMDRETVVRTP